MPKIAAENTKAILDCHISFGKKRVAAIRGYAKTKFGSNLIHVSVNREDQCFDVIVKADTKQIDIDDFETMWTMCKILKAK